MPVYDYLCETCGARFEEVFSIHDDSTYTLCPEWFNDKHRDALRNFHYANHPTPGHLAAAPREPISPDLARKIITAFPGVTHGMVKDTHYNMTTGSVIRSDAEFKNELSRKSDEASERNGFAVKFAPIDHREAKEHLGVTEEGLDSTYARRKAVESQ